MGSTRRGGARSTARPPRRLCAWRRSQVGRAHQAGGLGSARLASARRRPPSRRCSTCCPCTCRRRGCRAWCPAAGRWQPCRRGSAGRHKEAWRWGVLRRCGSQPLLLAPAGGRGCLAPPCRPARHRRPTAGAAAEWGRPPAQQQGGVPAHPLTLRLMYSTGQPSAGSSSAAPTQAGSARAGGGVACRRCCCGAGARHPRPGRRTAAPLCRAPACPPPSAPASRRPRPGRATSARRTHIRRRPPPGRAP